MLRPTGSHRQDVGVPLPSPLPMIWFALFAATVFGLYFCREFRIEQQDLQSAHAPHWVGERYIGPVHLTPRRSEAASGPHPPIDRNRRLDFLSIMSWPILAPRSADLADRGRYSAPWPPRTRTVVLMLRSPSRNRDGFLVPNAQEQTIQGDGTQSRRPDRSGV